MIEKKMSNGKKWAMGLEPMKSMEMTVQWEREYWCVSRDGEY